MASGPQSGGTRTARGPIVLVFSVTLLVSAALLFLIQPMFARFVLPRLGSTPQVWNTALVFFQAALLLGYLYAHVTTQRLGPRRQAALHLVVLLLPLVVLPLGVPDDFTPPAEGTPIPALLGLLAVSVGLPFFAVSTTAPLLQRWLADTDTPAGRDPYFLYRASNLGSIAGLLSYPLLLEPSLRLAEQGRLWTGGYVLFVVLMVVAVVLLWRSPRAPAEAASPERRLEAVPAATVGGDEAPSPAPAPAERPITLARRARWVGLAFAPSSLMLGVTTHLSTDIAPVPLLWVVPLTLYLLTFIIAFSGNASDWVLPAMLRALPLWVIVFVVILLLELKQPLALLVLLHLGAFLVVALACHLTLARDRPPARALTGFYLWISVGGALGGAFNALLAPVLFDSTAEYPLALVIACLLLPATSLLPPTRWTPWLDLALPVAIGAAVAGGLLLVGLAGEEYGSLGTLWVLGFGIGMLFLFGRRPLRLGLGVMALLAAASVGLDDGRRIFAERSFFGIHRVEAREDAPVNRLIHGNTVHGAQDRRRPAEPLTYYHRGGPVGDVFRSLPDTGPRRAGVIGLGTGTIACYGRPRERWTFFEIDPVVRRMAADPQLFSYLRDCPGESDVVLGDARLSLGKRADREFDLIVGDAFNSDAIPVHLLTREALDLYARKLQPGGVILFNVSNRYLDLEPVLGNLARERGWTCVARQEELRELQGVPEAESSHWLVLAPAHGDLGGLPQVPRWSACRLEPGAAPWTDDYSNLLSAL